MLVIKGHEVDDGPYGGAGTVSWTDMLIAQNGGTTGIEITTFYWKDSKPDTAVLMGVRFR